MDRGTFAVALALKAVALGMAALAIVFVAIQGGSSSLPPIFLAIGLFALAVASIAERRRTA